MALPGLVLHFIQFWMLVLVQGYFTLDNRAFFVLGDDSMIAMRYARNLATGGGLTWNPGERVEGYTNFLWTLAMAIPHVLGISERFTSLVVMIMACLAGLAVVWLVTSVVDAANCRWSSPLVAGMIAGASIQMASWGAAGFETSALALLAVASVRLVQQRSPIYAGIVLSLGVLTRDDFILVALTLAGLSLAAPISKSEAGSKMRWGSLLALVALPCLAATVHVLFRLRYYGDFVPNTYRLKVQGWQLLDRLHYGLRYVLPVLLPILLGTISSIWARGRARSGDEKYLLALSASLPMIFLLYALWVGGDAFIGTRLLAPAWPFMAIGIAVAIGLVQDFAVPKAVRVAGIALVIAAFVLSPWKAALHLYGYRPGVEAVLRATKLDRISWLGKFCRPIGDGILGRDFKSSRIRPGMDFSAIGVAACHVIRKDAEARGLKAPSMAVYFAGVPPYFCSKFRAVDILGKNDRHIAMGHTHRGAVAHNKWDYDYSLGTLAPDYFLSLIPDKKALSSLEYRNQPDGELNWHRVLDASAFWSRCSGNIIDEKANLIFRCGGR